MACAALIVAVAALLVWLAITVVTTRNLRELPRLPPLRAEAPERWPTLSLIVPARNEGAHLEAAVRSKLSIDYPGLEVLLVNDRSTDETGAIAARLAAEHPERLKVVTIEALPAGWLGKLHAMDRGVRVASGEWLLLTDADITFEPDTLRRAVQHCLDERLDFLAAMPRFLASGFVLDMALADSLRMILLAARSGKVADPESPAAMGAGVFGLVRRSAYDGTPGLGWLRIEVADDLAFGQMMKDSGARCGVVDASHELSVTMYRSVGDLVRGISKTVSSATDYRLARHLAASLVALSLPSLAWVGLALGVAGGSWVATGIAAIAGALQIASAVVTSRRFDMPTGPALLVPVGGVLVAAIMAVTGTVNAIRGTVTWRETTYTFDELRAGRRLRAPWRKPSRPSSAGDE